MTADENHLEVDWGWGIYPSNLLSKTSERYANAETAAQKTRYWEQLKIAAVLAVRSSQRHSDSLFERRREIYDLPDDWHKT